MRKRWAITAVLLAFALLGHSQDKSKNWSLSGYVKNMQTLLFFNDAYPDLQQGMLVDTFLQDNLIHNRLNFHWLLNDELKLRADLRTRVFYGDLVRATPGYGKSIDNVNNDYFDLSLILLNENAWVVHTMIDRLYLEYFKGNWEVRLGRQRINWGISTVWNPNDIFNAFSFTDFDYEERPGSDALRVKYYTGFASSVELAVRMFDNFDEATIAGMWKFNTGSYDIQVLGGYDRQNLVIGGGWAGNLDDAGLKGELTYFLPLEKEKNDAFAATVGIDYSFSNSLYINTGYLFNSVGSTTAGVSNLFEFELSARNLYPYRHAVFAQVSYPFTPLLNGGAAFIYSPVEVHALFANPTLTLSVAENWDLDFVGQVVFDKEQGKGFVSPLQAFFLRLKFSY
ncbi:MAG: hypothetical protein H6558_05145 [Lewinellaceae bacterium]|nr:hypothetical protein [Lewinellaceae bacterium]MCB9286015.1 hypothetical protein [Lewinellaceae bacterium]